MNFIRRPETKTLLALSGLVLVLLLTYSNHFESPFHFDDSHTIVDNIYIRELGNLPRFFTDTATFSVLPANRTYRPLVTASLAFDYWLAGGLKPFAFHVSTFVWFVVQLLLMFVLFVKVFNAGLPDPRNRWIALFAVALYGFHPAIAETVNYVIQRGDIYSTVGIVAGIVMYACLPRWRKPGFYLIPVVAALLSKPPALIFPALLYVYIWLFEREKPDRAFRQCIPALIVAGVIGFLTVAMTPPTFTPGSSSAYAYRITQPLVALRYFRTFFLPTQLSADSDFVAVKDLFDGGAWLGFVFVFALIAAAVWCSKRREWSPTAFGLWWFLLALVPTAIFPLAEVENDHRLYFPFVGLVLAVCSPIASWMRGRQPLPGRYVVSGAAIALLVIGVSAAATRQRNEVWRSNESLWLDVTIKSPRNGRGLMNYGLTQMEKGEMRKALEYFQRAAVFTPAYHVLEINTGIASGAMNLDAAAEEHFQRAVTLSPKQVESHYFYARWLHQKNRWPEAVTHLQEGMTANPDHMPTRHLLMQILEEQGNFDQMRTVAADTLQRFPSDPTTTAFLSRPQSPRQAPAAPQTAEGYLNLSLAYHRAGKFKESLAAAQEALKLRPNYAEAYNNIAAAYEEMSMWDQAIEAAQQALKIKPDFQLARNNLAWSLQQKSKTQNRK